MLPPKAICDAVSSAVGHIDLPFLVPVPAVGVHITVQGASRLPDPIEQRLPQLLDAVEGELAQTDTFDATLAEPVSDTAAWSAMYRQGSGSRPYATQLGVDSIAWCQCPRRGAFNRPISQRARGPRRPTRGARLA